MKNIKELVTKFALIKEVKDNVINGEISLQLYKINEELADIAANIVGAIDEAVTCDAASIADGFGGTNDPEESFIKASALMEALDKGVALLNKRARVDSIDTEIIAEKAMITAYRGIKDVDCDNSRYSEAELGEAKTVVCQKFAEIASKFAEAIRSYSQLSRNEAINKLTIRYVEFLFEIYRGDK